MSIPFENKEPKCILYKDDVEYLLDECNFSINEGKKALIKVISTNFTHMKIDSINGTAIHFENCGLECNRTLFIDCVTSEGCGCAIYIRNTFDVFHNITFEDLTFISCKAICGGAVFVHSDKEESEVLIRNCTFLRNEVYRKRASNGINLFGGSAIYLAAHDSNMIGCSFKENVGSGGCVKIQPIVHKNKRIHALEMDQKPIRISGCNFEIKKESESSIFYENDEKEIEIIECNFKGKLKKGSHYIDGNIADKDKLQIKNCIFESNISVHFESTNNKPFKKYMMKKSLQNLTKVFICVFVFVSVFILMIIKLVKKRFYNENIIESLESEDLSNNQENSLLNDL